MNAYTHLSNSSFHDDTDERERVHTFGFAFPDSHRGEKTKPHARERRTRFLNGRMHRGCVCRMRVRVFNRLKNRRRRERKKNVL